MFLRFNKTPFSSRVGKDLKKKIVFKQIKIRRELKKKNDLICFPIFFIFVCMWFFFSSLQSLTLKKSYSETQYGKQK